MAASLMDNGDVFFQRFNETIGEIAANSTNVINLFQWADRKANIAHPEGIVTGRLYYLSIGLIFDNDKSMSRARARQCQAALAEAEKFLQASAQPVNIFHNPLTAFPMGLNQKRADNEALELDRSYDLPAELETGGAPSSGDVPQVDIELSRLSFISSLFARSVEQGPRRVLASRFAAYYQRLRDRYDLQPPVELEESATEINPIDKHLVPDRAWLHFDDQLQSFLQQKYDVGHEWRLGEHHVAALTNMIRASSLMSDCLKVAAIADRAGITADLFSLVQSDKQRS